VSSVTRRATELRFRAFLLPALILALAVPARAQVFADAFNGKRDGWESRLKRGDAAAVRQEIETFLTVQGANASPSNYGDQHAIVGARGLEARACVASGEWEAALANLQKASATAGENLSATEVSFAKLRADHAEKLTLWKGELGDAQAKLDQLNAAPGLTEDQMKLKGQLQTFVAEHQSSIQHSEDALKAMDGALVTLRQEKADYEASAAAWTAFIDKEKADITAAGSAMAYVSQKTEQVKADDAKSPEERLDYVERLLKLDPANAAALRLKSALQGKPLAEATPKRKAARKKR
jgi:hypothetical protein